MASLVDAYAHSCISLVCEGPRTRLSCDVLGSYEATRLSQRRYSRARSYEQRPTRSLEQGKVVFALLATIRADPVKSTHARENGNLIDSGKASFRRFVHPAEFVWRSDAIESADDHETCSHGASHPPSR